MRNYLIGGLHITPPKPQQLRESTVCAPATVYTVHDCMSRNKLCRWFYSLYYSLRETSADFNNFWHATSRINT